MQHKSDVNKYVGEKKNEDIFLWLDFGGAFTVLEGNLLAPISSCSFSNAQR